MLLTVTLNASIDKRYTVEAFVKEKANRVTRCLVSAGGKGLNVSRAAALLGESVVATGFAGGYAGDFILQELNRENIVADFVHIQEESRTCINIFDQSTKEQTEILEPGPSVSNDSLEEFIRCYSELVTQSTIVSISGSLPGGVTPGFYVRLIDIAKMQHRPVILDTSGAALKAGLRAKPDLIKPNADELEMLLGEKPCGVEQIVQAARKLHRDGIKNVVVSLGAQGAVYICDEGGFFAQSPKVNVVNTVGCGDSMIASFAKDLPRRIPPKEMLRNAVAVASANAMTENTAFFRKEDYDALRSQIKVSSI